MYIEGSLRTRKWQDQGTGQDRYMTEIVASEMQMLDSRGAGQQDGYAQQASQQATPTYTSAATAFNAATAAAAGSTGG